MIQNPTLLPKVRSDDLMNAMRHYPCALRVSSFYPGHACSPQATVVGCHLSTPGKSNASKSTDMAVAAGCLHCHDIIDGRDRKRLDFIQEKYPTALVARLLQGLIETQARLVADGIISVRNGSMI